MKTILFGLLLGQILCAAEIPTLRFDERVTWKQVFDDGFRPKHLDGLEDHMCVCQNQTFWVQFKDRELKFKVDNGRVAFSFYYDDFLNMVWHQGAEAITLEEGKRRADEFRKVFDGYIVKDITMPPLIDPSGLVDAGNAENNIEARIGEYVIWYGFDNSMGKVKPIIPHFYIAWSFPGKPDMRLKDARDVVRPPKGYEWYSLDPKVNTPDPGAKAGPVSRPEISEPVNEKPPVPRADKKAKPPVNLDVTTEETQWVWWAGLLALLIVVGITLFRKISSKKSESH